MKKRLSKALAAAGIASRRQCEEIIAQKRVQVNGQTTTVPETLVDWEKDIIVCDGERVHEEEKKVYFLLHKPTGYLCTTERKGPKTKLILDLLPAQERLFTVGRLDKETSGLILITNDGTFAQRVIHPSFEVSKEYIARTGHEILDTHLKTLSKGAYIEGTFIKPLSVEKVRRGTLKITVAEGKKHEVRLLLANAGLTCLSLCRIRLGPFTLGTLPLGAYRSLSSSEINTFLAKN